MDLQELGGFRLDAIEENSEKELSVRQYQPSAPDGPDEYGVRYFNNVDGLADIFCVK